MDKIKATEMVKKGAWVEIHAIVLEKDERSPNVPEDTRSVPLEMTAKGYLDHDARPGEKVRISTATGRRLAGKLTRVNPAYSHVFGPPVFELQSVGNEVAEFVKPRKNDQ